MSARLSLATAIAIAALATFAACSSHSRPGSDRVGSAEAHTLVSSGATLLDVRTAEVFSARHLEGALNVPVDEVGARLAEIPRDKPVVVTCQSRARAATATATLRAKGYDARNLGGIAPW